MEGRRRRLAGLADPPPSFSSTLLDAIYRSIDDELGDADAAVKERISPPKAVLLAGRTKPPRCYQPPGSARSTSSSSDCSSYGGFSSSEAESAPTTGRLRPIRTSLPAALNDQRTYAEQLTRGGDVNSHRAERKKPFSIPSRLRDFRKPRPSASPAALSTPPSPGGRLASFLNSLFSPSTKKPKAAVMKPSSAPPSVSSCSRSCLTRDRESPKTIPYAPFTSSATAKRSVRFAGEDAPKPKATRAGQDAALLRRLAAAVAAESSGDESDASDDLFELESIALGGGGGGGELPVYETTRPRSRGI